MQPNHKATRPGAARRGLGTGLVAVCSILTANCAVPISLAGRLREADREAAQPPSYLCCSKEDVAMRLYPKSHRFDDATVSDSDLIGFASPNDIVQDPLLSLGRKRQLLAFWASDIHAVPGAPALRSYRMGPVVPIDAIKDALAALDERVDFAAIPSSSVNSATA